MGMYTELHFNSELKQIIPGDVIAVLKHMVEDDGKLKINLPEHTLFKTAIWNRMLRSDSFYFAAETISTLKFCEISEAYYLCIRCNLQDPNAIELFIDWIMPYLESYDGKFLGFYRYEENETPTLIHYKEKTDDTTQP